MKITCGTSRRQGCGLSLIPDHAEVGGTVDTSGPDVSTAIEQQPKRGKVLCRNYAPVAQVDKAAAF
jgi:hypothetical protein